MWTFIVTFVLVAILFVGVVTYLDKRIDKKWYVKKSDPSGIQYYFVGEVDEVYAYTSKGARRGILLRYADDPLHESKRVVVSKIQFMSDYISIYDWKQQNKKK